jgi:RNA polymerase sigma-70 factor (ECF subfamily)
VNVAHDYFKSRHSKKRGAGEVPQSIENVEPKGRSGDLGAQGSMERAILLKEIDECLATCSQGNDQERDRLIFWLYYQQGMSAKAIAALPTIGLTAKGVESALFRLTRLVRERMAGIRLQPETGSQPDKKGFRPAESY